MNRTQTILAVAVASLACATAVAQEDKVAQAVTPLPDDLKAGAGVYEYDDNGNRVTLREASNYVECQPRDDNGFTTCWPTSTAARRDYSAKLSAEGLSGGELQAALGKAEADGKIKPFPAGTMLYRAYDNADRIQLLWVVLLPEAASDELGMSTLSQRDNALAGKGMPWMMAEGTAGAHLMIPINGTDISNAGGAMSSLDTRAIKDPVEHATLPLPEELRPYAAVIDYDEDGNRQVLRPGRNAIECQVRDEASGFTRCYHRSQGPVSDMRAKLLAEGKSAEEVGEAIAAAVASGELPAPAFGSLSYRLYEEDDRLKLLWVMRVPNAMAADLGMSTASQRDPSLEGRGLPWMMREGTPAAHLMIPINGTELSNRK